METNAIIYSDGTVQTTALGSGGSGTITGTGTTNKAVQFVSSTSIGDSSFSQSGSNVIITPGKTLNVSSVLFPGSLNVATAGFVQGSSSTFDINNLGGSWGVGYKQWAFTKVENRITLVINCSINSVNSSNIKFQIPNIPTGIPSIIQRLSSPPVLAVPNIMATTAPGDGVPVLPLIVNASISSADGVLCDIVLNNVPIPDPLETVEISIVFQYVQ